MMLLVWLKKLELELLKKKSSEENFTTVVMFKDLIYSY